jgi:tRNA(adenine34) deaminase
MFFERDVFWMQQALELARQAAHQNEVPVGAVVVLDDQVLGQGYNFSITRHDPTAHAEIMALRAAAQRLSNYRLVQSTLYVTLEPCVMCAGALVHARIKRLVYGACDPKAGAITSVASTLDLPFLNHRVDHAGGLLAGPCGELLSQFFKARR